MIFLKSLLTEKKSLGAKIHRDAFLYLNPRGDKEKFAQCGTCRLFTGKKCLILGDTKVAADDSCGLYIHDKPQLNKAGEEKPLVTPKEAGFVSRQVRCENCRSFEDGKCRLFETLNKSNPDIFDLNEKVDAHGCCNGQMPK